MAGVRLALIGEFDEGVLAHRAIERTLGLATAGGLPGLAWDWLRTDAVAAAGPESLEAFDGIWCVPATPYASMDGALAAIRFARERGRPFLGTCGGFQHALVEYARAVLGWPTADHAETSANGGPLVVTPLSCALVETTAAVRLREGSRIRAICCTGQLREGYRCGYGLSPAYRERFERAGLDFGAEDEQGDVRALELPDHPFFVGTLFQPERAALEDRVHPVCAAFLGAAAAQAAGRVGAVA